MNDGSSRIFIQIDEILIHVLDDQLVGFFGHPRMNESMTSLDQRGTLLQMWDIRRQVEQRIAIELCLVVQELVRRLGVDAGLGHGVFGSLCRILVATPRLVITSTRTAAGVLLVVVLLARLDELFGVD